MNDHDKRNLEFILSLTTKEFEDWYECLDDDDIAYAMEIIKAGRIEVAVKMASLYDEIKDVSEAQTILRQFTLKGA